MDRQCTAGLTQPTPPLRPIRTGLGRSTGDELTARHRRPERLKHLSNHWYSENLTHNTLNQSGVAITERTQGTTYENATGQKPFLRRRVPEHPPRRRFSLTQVLRHSRFQPRRRIQQDRPTTESRQHQKGFPPGHTADITAVQTRWLVSPSPLHTPTPGIRAGQRPSSPASTVV